MKKIFFIASTILSLVLLLLLLNAKRVVDDDMAGSIRQGDWVWYIASTIKAGDMVVLQNPLQPSQKIIRRAIATEEQTIKYERNGSFRINGKRIRQKDMGREKEWRIIEETSWSKPPAISIKWLIMRKLEPIHWEMKEPFVIPKNHWFLLADRRDEAVDSRWWGSVHKEKILGVVRMRAGSSDAWRSWVEIY